MSFVQIPIDSTLPSFIQRVTLANNLFFLRFDWSDAEGRWIMGIMDQLNSPILMGLPMNEGEDLIGRFQVSLPNLPKGLLMLYDTTLQNNEAGRNDLGKSIVLVFNPA